MAGRQTTNPRQQGVGAGFLPTNVDERLGENLRIEGAIDPGQGEESFEFGREGEGAGVKAVMQRLDAKTVARQEQPTLLGIPDGKRPHAIEAQLALLSPLRIGGEDDLAVAVRDETVAEAAQLLAQLEIVVDLTVIGEPVAPLGIGHWLPARSERSRMASRRWPSQSRASGKCSMPKPSGPRWARLWVKAANTASARSCDE